jgi:AraC-like DNA-binding protein
MMPSPLPLDRYPLVRARSLEEAIHIQASLSAPAKVELLDRREPFGWEANRLPLGDLGIVASRYKAGFHARSLAPGSVFSFMIPSKNGVAKLGGRSADLVGGKKGALTCAAEPGEFAFETAYETRSVGMPIQTVETMLDTLTGRKRSEQLRFELSVDLQHGGGAAAMRLVDYIVREADHPVSALDSPLVKARLAEALIVALLTGLPHNYSEWLAPESPRVNEPAYVRRAEDYMQANAHRHISLADLAAVTGMSIRTLSAAFRTHRGSSPMEFLRDRRFDLARSRLLAAPPTVSVAEIALSCGFAHLGRFGITYRARFGESPSETRKRARRNGRH